MQAFQTSSSSIVISTSASPGKDLHIDSKAQRAHTDVDFNMEVMLSENSQSLVIHTITCFASFIKIHACQLHLQLSFPASQSRTVGPYSLH